MGKSGKSLNWEALRKFRTENAKSKSSVMKPRAQSRERAKKNAAPAKPNPQPKKKVASKKNRTLVRSDGQTKPGKGKAEFLAPADLQAKRDRADAVLAEVQEGLKQFSETTATLHEKIAVAIQEESWKWCSYKHADGTIGPFKSWTACLGAMAEDNCRSVSRVMEISGFVRALVKYLSPSEIAALPVRKARLLRDAANEAQKQDSELPQSVIREATDPQADEDDLACEIEAQNLDAEKPAPIDDRQSSFDPLLSRSENNTLPEKLSKGGSGKVEGQPGTAQQTSSYFSEEMEEAIKLAQFVYDPNFTRKEALDFIGKHFKLSFYSGEREDFYVVNKETGEETAIFTNVAAADEIRKTQKKNGKAAHA